MDPNLRATATASLHSSGTRDFQEIVAAIARWPFPEKIDGVVAIANGGIVPGALVAQHLGVGLKTVTVAYRNEINEPQFAEPVVAASVPGVGDWRRVLLVDDSWLSGKSWTAARDHLPRHVAILPFVLQGEVDFALFRGPVEFVRWPWAAA